MNGPAVAAATVLVLVAYAGVYALCAAAKHGDQAAATARRNRPAPTGPEDPDLPPAA